MKHGSGGGSGGCWDDNDGEGGGGVVDDAPLPAAGWGGKQPPLEAVAVAPEINECVWRVVEEVSPLLLTLNRSHVGTLQRRFKKISDAWKRFMTKNIVNLFQASDVSIVRQSAVAARGLEEHTSIVA